MLSPLLGWNDREVIGIHKVNSVTAAGVAVQINSATLGPITGTSPYATVFGDVIPASITVQNDRELGYLLQPVSATGPALLSILSQIYDESVPAGATAAILPSKAGAYIASDQFVNTGGSAAGQILLDGTVTPGTLCGIANGLFRTKLAGDIARVKFLGKVVQRQNTLAAFQIH